jgi:hypothetical protein
VECYPVIYVDFIIAGHTPGMPPPENYKPQAKRFVESYKAHPAGVYHELLLVNSNGGLYDRETRGYFSEMPHTVLDYHGLGCDIGGHQFAAHCLDPDDWIFALSSWAWFKREGWLRAFVEAREKHGDCLYGAMASLEVDLHLRGTGFFCRAGRIQQYPFFANTRTQSFAFEAGPDSLTRHYIKNGWGAYLVTPDGIYPPEDFRRPENIFRRGDQSNIWTFDRHTDLYDSSTPEEKIVWEDKAEGRT